MPSTYKFNLNIVVIVALTLRCAEQLIILSDFDSPGYCTTEITPSGMVYEK